MGQGISFGTVVGVHFYVVAESDVVRDSWNGKFFVEDTAAFEAHYGAAGIDGRLRFYRRGL
jgi:hypothetical protein